MAVPRIALTHHWLVSPGGAEKVLYELHQLYPDAPIYTAAYDQRKFPEFADADIRTTYLDKIPFLKFKHQLFPIFLGTPFKTLDMRAYDIVISSCAAEAKYVRTNDSTLHICYCHTPVRYYWSDYKWRLNHLPFGRLNWLARVVFPLLISLLKGIDYRAAQGVNYFVANSHFIKGRIKTYYRRDSDVIYPPVDVNPLSRIKRSPKDFYLIVGRQVASKRLDVAVDAFNQLGLPLKVAGVGEEIDVQKKRAQSNIQFLGRVSDADRNELFAGAKGFIFPAEEDFGIVPVEAMATGAPVLAYNGGGAPEYVIDGITGVLFDRQDGRALIEAVKRFEGLEFDEKVIRDRARAFDSAVFRKKMADYVNKKWVDFTSSKDKN